MIKFKFEKIERSINYFDIQKEFYKKDGELLTWEEIEEIAEGKDDIPENVFPFNIRDFTKLGFKFGKVELECSDNKDNVVNYTLDANEQRIVIKSDKFTLKEALTIINMISAQIYGDKWAYEVIFGRTTHDDFTIYHQESTMFGMWWEDFIRLFDETKDTIESIEMTMERDRHHIIVELVTSD